MDSTRFISDPTVLQEHTISNQVGYCKPNIEIYELIQSLIYGTALDDQAKNMKPAAKLGWETLLADEQHHWNVVIDGWITDQR